MAISESTCPVEISNLNFHYTDIQGIQTGDKILKDVNVTITPGQRCVVVGANGAGKSTLLRIIAGKHITPIGTVYIYGREGFRDTSLNAFRTYVGAETMQRSVAFSGNTVGYGADIPVYDMMKTLQESFPERKKILQQVLRIDPQWRMHRLSDGQRKRVQLFLALLRPARLVILDEVLGLLDVITRQDFLNFLKQENEQNGVTVLFASNVFDGLDLWATHLLYIKFGKIGYHGELKDMPEFQEHVRCGRSEPLMRSVETLLRRECDDIAAGKEKRVMEVESGVGTNEGSAIVRDEYVEKGAGGYAAGRLTHFTSLS